MSGIRVRAGHGVDVTVLPGPRLLAGVLDGGSLPAHRAHWPEPGALTARAFVAMLAAADVRGRGGAAFPLARKVSAALAASRRREVVVNASEGEPASAKDSALMMTVPHLVLDGADVVARALGVRTVHIVVPGERRPVTASVEEAVAERRGRVRYQVHVGGGRFVGGQSQAVIELLERRPNLPVTAWQPAAVRGLRGRPTVLSNAETFAQVAALASLGVPGYARLGLPAEPGTTLLTVGGEVVLEVPFGTSVADVLWQTGSDAGGPVLVGGYAGAWLPADQVARGIGRDLARAGAPLGAGVLLPLAAGLCPVDVTARIVDYLAGQSAGRCGPCRLGLPALATAAASLAAGASGSAAAARMSELAGTIAGRGACAHPDGAARLVRSLLRAFPAEAAAHGAGGCLFGARLAGRVGAR